MRKRILWLAIACVSIAACESTDPGGPGTLTASVISPNGPEGAAILDVTGVVDTVTSGGDLRTFSTRTPNGRRIIVVRGSPGPLSVRLRVPDVSQPPQVSVVEVADGDDKLRSSLDGYTVEFQ